MHTYIYTYHTCVFANIYIGCTCTTDVWSIGVSKAWSRVSTEEFPFTARLYCPAPVPPSTDTIPPRTLADDNDPLPSGDIESVTPVVQ